MENQQEDASKKDGIVFALIFVIGSCLFMIYDDIFSVYFRYIACLSLVLSFIAAMMGRERRIGFGTVFFISLLLSPVVGFIFALTSPRTKDYDQRKKLDQVVYNTTMADQLLKMNELKKEGILTEEEFQAQKEKILGNQGLS